MPLTPEQRVLRARIANAAMWAKTTDTVARSQAKREAFYRRFEDEVDPDRTLDPAERERRATAARRAYMLRLALASSKARAARAASKKAGDPGATTAQAKK